MPKSCRSEKLNCHPKSGRAAFGSNYAVSFALVAGFHGSRCRLHNSFSAGNRDDQTCGSESNHLRRREHLSISFCLQFEELGVASGFAQEFVVATLFQDAAGLQHQDAVGNTDGREAVRDRSAERPLQISLNRSKTCASARASIAAVGSSRIKQVASRI